MNKNNIIGFVLIAAVLIGYSFWSRPSAEQQAEMARQDSIAAVAQQKAEAAQQMAEEKKTAEAKAALIADTTALFHKAMHGTDSAVVLKNDKVELTFNTKGATVEKAVIKNFADREGNPNVTLFNKKEQSLRFTAETGEGKSLQIKYVLGHNYLLHMQLQANGMQGLFSPNTNTMDIAWNEQCRQQEKGYMFENRYATLTYHKSEGGVKHLTESGADDKTIEEKIDWVAFKTQFFATVMIAKNDFAANAQLYLGWPLFRIINRWFTLYVFDFLTGLNINMGIVLILITLLLKVITYPLVKKSYMSSAKMRVLKPKLEEATKQYNAPEDQMKKQQAMMAEYAKYGVSPLSGCLPMLIQAPIWIAMFNFVPNAIQLRGESFLWIKDLSTYDPIFEWHHNIWLLGDHLSLTCVLFCVSQLLYSWMTMRQQRDQMVGQQAEQMKMMQWMMFLMPLMFFFMFNDYSAGLNFYYFISLFFSAAIMWTLRKTTNDEKLLAILEARYEENKNKPQKLSGLAARLQAMQEQQQELQRQREELQRKRNMLGK